MRNEEKMNITIKNLKVCKFASEETMCFEAMVYVDGKKAFTASNGGTGGCNNYHQIPDGKGGYSGHDLIDQAHAWTKTLPPLKSTYGDLKMDLDLYIDGLIQAIEDEKQLDKLLKKGAFIKPDGNVYTIKGAPSADDRKYLSDKFPGTIFLTDLSRTDAMAAMKKAGA